MQAPDPRQNAQADLALITQAAEAAGQTAMGYFQADVRRWEKEDNAGPVTEADLAVDAELADRLRGARPAYGWLSEESDGPGWQDRDCLFIVDPIDGTRSYIEGSRTWAISIAVVMRGTPVAAAVHLPARDLTYAAAIGIGATKNGIHIRISENSDPSSAEVLSAKVNFKPERWRRPIAAPNLNFRSSLAYRMALVAEGRFDAMVTLRRTWDWDVAAGALLVTEAGGQVRTAIGGAEPAFGGPSRAQPGLLAGTPSIMSWMLDHGPRLTD
ncbi:MAG: 3'(2'),5'-bisphosphate nucleotidase CysQ [Pseudomonadota bacterium]